MSGGREGTARPRLSVGIVGICGPEALERCLEALCPGGGRPGFEIVVAHDPELEGFEAVGERFPFVRLVANVGQRTPLELASRAIEATRGEIVLLTEDHCVPDPGWVERLSAALRPGRAAVGGAVACAQGASAVDWAFYFVDFFRYAEPLREGPSPSLTVCNVAYRRADLEAIAPVWEGFFHETAVNRALATRDRPLWLVGGARVTMQRRVRLRDALAERYAFGRLFGCTRLAFESRARRWLLAALAPGLPLLLLARMAWRALPEPALRRAWIRALVPLGLMVLAWSWGEWIGVLTRRRPRRLTVAPSRPPGGRLHPSAAAAIERET